MSFLRCICGESCGGMPPTREILLCSKAVRHFSAIYFEFCFKMQILLTGLKCTVCYSLLSAWTLNYIHNQTLARSAPFWYCYLHHCSYLKIFRFILNQISNGSRYLFKLISSGLTSIFFWKIPDSNCTYFVTWAFLHTISCHKWHGFVIQLLWLKTWKL